MSWSISLLSGTKLSPNFHFHHKLPVDYSITSLKQVRCIPVEQQAESGISGTIMCEPCRGSGWLLCDFCNGQKTNVKAANNKIYRRCPSCKAVGYMLCSKCKVFKCVTFPDFEDGEDLIF
ncbi:hypothetical protein Leryth_010485 [Lithospermum erythrorhizon]|nr:hypothetical protein Leryth_010485 [Lithospermum erythrorhizon]